MNRTGDLSFHSFLSHDETVSHLVHLVKYVSLLLAEPVNKIRLAAILLLGRMVLRITIPVNQIRVKALVLCRIEGKYFDLGAEACRLVLGEAKQAIRAVQDHRHHQLLSICHEQASVFLRSHLPHLIRRKVLLLFNQPFLLPLSLSLEILFSSLDSHYLGVEVTFESLFVPSAQFSSDVVCHNTFKATLHRESQAVELKAELVEMVDHALDDVGVVGERDQADVQMAVSARVVVEYEAVR